MDPRETFLKGEVKRIKMLLDVFYENFRTCSVLEDDKRLKKIVQILFEVNEKVNRLRKISED